MTHLPEYRNLVGGELRPAASGRCLESVDPATGEAWALIPAGNHSDVEDAVAAAAEAFPAWSSMPAATRAYHLQQVGRVFVEHGEELARLETRDNGRLLEENRIHAGVGMAFTWNRAGEATLEAVTGRSVVLDSTTIGITRREPYGVVAAVIPWNAPVAMLSSKASLALAAGNTVVVKPAEQACVSVLRFGELVADILPPGVLNIVSGLGPDAGQPLVAHHQVKKNYDDWLE